MKDVEIILRCVNKKYGVSVELNEIKESNERKTQLPTRMINIERTKSYTIYTIISRLIRLCDRESLEGN